MNRDQVYVITCVDYKSTYIAPGVKHTPGSMSYKHTEWVGGQWKEIKDETGEERLK